MFGLGPFEILVILVLALLIFGRRLPEIGRGVGKSIVEFKKGMAGIEEELHIEDPIKGKTASKPSKNLESNASATTETRSKQTNASSNNDISDD